MNQQNCRVCDEPIGLYGWPKHVAKHKRQFCKENGVDPDDYFLVSWEVVVEYFNPKNKKKKNYTTERSNHIKI